MINVDDPGAPNRGARVVAALHYLLAFVALVTVGASLWLSNALVGDFQNTIDEYEEWAGYVAATSSLADDLTDIQTTTFEATDGADHRSSRARVEQTTRRFQRTM